MEFFNIWRINSSKSQFNQLFQQVLLQTGCTDASGTTLSIIQSNISRIISRVKSRWEKSGRHPEIFSKNFEGWLNGDDFILFEGAQDEYFIEKIPTSVNVGRPLKTFEESSSKTKKRRVADIVQEKSAQEITFAAELALRSAKKRSAANIVRDVASCSSSFVKEIQDLKKTYSKQRSMTPEEALAFYVDTKSTSFSYKLNRKKALSLGHKLYPSYYALSNAKRACFPSAINITEIGAELSLQSTLDHWIKRLLKSDGSIFEGHRTLELSCKWGCNGSSGHSRYKQKFSNFEANEEFLFLISFVPIELKSETHSVWQNPSPSSTRYCKPLKFIFQKETDELTKTEVSKIQNQIDSLNPTDLFVDGINVTINYKFFLTMLDGKVCNVLTETKSAMRSYICGATPKTLNDEPTEASVKVDSYRFGLSTLHVWIRVFECLLHISYRLDIKKWQIRSDAEKAILKTKKELVQKRFREEMGLIIDQPKPGSGNSNDGNSARRFFRDPLRSAEITGIDFNLIEDLGILLQTLSCGQPINLEKFEQLCFSTKNLYLSLYSWYIMPVTLHKLFYHASSVIKYFIVPIGQLSEEAQEARHKDCRRYREKHTRKISRTSTNSDLLSMLLITSDPLINSFCELPKKKIGSLSSKVVNLLAENSNEIVQHKEMTRINATDSEEYMATDSPESDEDTEDSGRE